MTFIAKKDPKSDSWNLFKVFLRELKPEYLRYIESALKEVGDLRDKKITYYQVTPEYFDMVKWINENHTGIVSSYDGLLKVIDSCDKPFGKQTIFNLDNSQHL